MLLFRLQDMLMCTPMDIISVRSIICVSNTSCISQWIWTSDFVPKKLKIFVKFSIACLLVSTSSCTGLWSPCFSHPRSASCCYAHFSLTDIWVNSCVRLILDHSAKLSLGGNLCLLLAQFWFKQYRLPAILSRWTWEDEQMLSPITSLLDGWECVWLLLTCTR
jgi:hypothetical protein